ncbi:MAG: prepilin-type N-terminal cleavage/methylation domain-containing protein [Phycisphaerae bacterium]|nr:prepilin-type N-terminal cleavage/methylation domain-containing protein [Phycisphaerae bacterium]
MTTTARTMRGFTLIEIMVATAIIGILIAVIITATAAAHKQSQVTRTRQTIAMLSEAVTAFKNATGYYPLAVPIDACDREQWDRFVRDDRMGWRAGGDPPDWDDYFFRDTSSDAPAMNWEGVTEFSDGLGGVAPTNNDFLVFQLEQVPQSNSILEQIRTAAPAETSRRPDASGQWQEASGLCQLGHPLDADGTYRQVRQVQDAWGIPLRYWSGDIMKWAKRIGPGDPAWPTETQRHLAEKLQAANWGFFIESAGPDELFGWWGDRDEPFNATRVADNIHSTDE